MRRNNILILFILVSFPTSKLFSQNWPILPQNVQHRIVGTIGENRNTNRFHKGCDVGSDIVGTQSDVYSTQTGIATVSIDNDNPGSSYVLINGLYYIHVVGSVANGMMVTAGQKIGRMAAITGPHVHLQSGPPTQENLNLISTLNPYSDNARPDIRDLQIFANGLLQSNTTDRFIVTKTVKTQSALVAYNKLDFMTYVSDPNTKADGSAGAGSMMPYETSYQLRDRADGKISDTIKNIKFALAPLNNKVNYVFHREANLTNHKIIITNNPFQTPYDRYYNSNLRTGVEETWPNNSTLDARYIGESLYPDNLYHLRISTRDIDNDDTYNHDDSTQIILIDNFLPYISKVEMKTGASVIYSAGWSWNGSTLEFKPAKEPVGTDKDVTITAYSSEPLNKLSISISKLSIPSTAMELVPNSDSTKWEFKIPASILSSAEAGSYEISFDGVDYADNPLAVKASDLSIRQSDGSWLPKANTGIDKTYNFNIGNKGVNVSFLIDDTGSMTNDIEGAKQAILGVLNSKAYADNTNNVYQLTTFKDNVSQRDPTSDLEIVKNEVSKLFASGGGECPEASAEAVDAVTNNIAPGGTIFLATDAATHSGIDITALGEKVRAKGASLFIILSGNCFEPETTTLTALGNTSQLDPSLGDYINSDNHDTAMKSAPKGINVNADLPANANAIQTFSFLANLTGGSFAYVPEVKTGNADDLLRYENIAYNMMIGSIVPAIVTVEPRKAPYGSTVALTITSAKTGFSPATTLSFNDNGITVKSLKVLSPTKLEALITIDSSATLGFKNIKARAVNATGIDTAEGIGLLQVVNAPSTPTVLSISPASGKTGEILTVTITGINTNFSNSSIVNLGSGISILKVEAVSKQELKADIRIEAGAVLGYHNIRVTTGSQVATENVVGPFLVIAAECDLSSLNIVQDKTINLFYADSSCATLSVSGIDSTTLSGYTYKWSTGDTTASIKVCPSVNTIYSVIISNGSCSTSDSINVEVARCPRDITVVAPSCKKTEINWIEPKDAYPTAIAVPVELDPSRGILNYMGSFDEHGYYMSNNSYLWPNARDVANLVGGNGVNGHLVTITKAEENDFIFKQIKGSGYSPWIGLSSTRPGRFRWVNGEDVDYTNWAPGEPNNDGGNRNNVFEPYVRFSEGYGTWNDQRSDAFPFIAEFEKPLIRYKQISGPKNGSMQKVGKYMVCYQKNNLITDQKDTCCFEVNVICDSSSAMKTDNIVPNTITNATQESKAFENNSMGLKAMIQPNPSSTQFIVKIESENKERISLKIWDVTGRILEARNGLEANKTIQIGNSFRPGLYFIEVTQGTKRIVKKLVKQSR